ncbi:MAG: hypothetical protein EP330_04640 [Deltaproteobacteria bacterium]|nr:MAG: hypothetical protein EP330_04640 [Deltaproteobacteria bacterium]
MDSSVRHIGLSLGADLCWPAAFEDLLNALDLDIEHDGERMTFSVERVTVHPFDLQYKPKYDLVIDRITHWFNTSREWVKKIALMDGVYVLNNPWAIQSMEKHTSYAAMMRLGMRIPKTWMIPPKEYEDEGDTKVTVQRYNRLFDLAKLGEEIGYPAFLKPYDGGGWVGVTRVTDSASLHAAYDKSGKRVQHLQAAVQGWDRFVRGVGIGPQVMLAKYDPDQPLHGRYVPDEAPLTGDEAWEARATTKVINAFFRWDFNSCEMLRADGELHPIDFANACPDSQVTSLHYYFPQLVLNLLKWSIFCAATRRKPSLSMDWESFFAIAAEDIPYRDKLVKYEALADAHFDTAAFDAFCAEHLGDLPRVADAYFASDRFREVTRAKVAALYPEHEIDVFTNHFFDQVQTWRAHHPVES